MTRDQHRTREIEQRIRDNEEDLLRYFQRRLDNGADAADGYSETLFVVWKQRRKLPTDPQEARMWLFGIAKNVIRNSCRGHARRTAATARLAEAIAVKRAGPDGNDAVRQAINGLPFEQAELIRLIYWDGFKTYEAANILGINPSTARSRVAAARGLLAETLEDDEGYGLQTKRGTTTSKVAAAQPT